MTASPDDTARIRLRDEERPIYGDIPELLGKLMGGLARLERRELNTSLEVNTLTREVSGLRRDLDLDRAELVRSSSKHAAVKSSNRMAGLLGALFVLYTEAAPILHELWRGMHH